MKKALASILLCVACSPQTQGLREGSEFPRQSYARLEGPGVITLGRDSGVVVVNVWATWCGPCRREMASLDELHRNLSAEGVRVIGISVDEDRNLAAEFVRARQLTFDNALGDAGALGSGPLAVRRFPTTFVIDAAGIIRWREEGARNWADEAAVARIRGLARGA